MHCGEVDYRNRGLVEDAMFEIHQFEITAIPVRDFFAEFVASEFVLFPIWRTHVCRESLKLLLAVVLKGL